MGQIIDQSVRSTDLAARFVEDTVALLFLKATANDMEALCQRLSREIDNRLAALGLQRQVKLTIGLVDSHGEMSVESLLQKALDKLRKSREPSE